MNDTICGSRVIRPETTHVRSIREAAYRTIGLVESCRQSSNEPTYTRAGTPTANAAQYIRLARPQHKWHDAEEIDLASWAAAYGFGLVKNHPYRDGNKRIGLLAMVTFLGIHGYDLKATDVEVVTEILALADSRVSEKELADWIRTHSRKLK